jgi:hypothetical protein
VSLLETKILRMKGYEVRKYFRKWSRQTVNLPAKVEILTQNGKKFTSGTAIIRDISLRGARLAKFVLKKPMFPVGNFRIKLSFRSQTYQGIGAIARPVRFGQGDEFELAVAFEDFWAQVDEEK